MYTKWWKIGLAIAGFFVIIALVYSMSATDLWTADHLSQAEEEPGDRPEEQDDTPSVEAGDREQDEEVDQQAPQILLQEGDTGEAVRELQERLKALGYDLEVDGQYGVTTRWYIKDFQLQLGLTGDGIYNTETESLLQQAQQNEVSIDPGKAIHLNMSERTVTNPDDLLVLVNKTRSMPADYEPEELVEPDVPLFFQGKDLPYNKIRRVAAEALEQLFARGQEEGLQFVARSGYRSYETQVAVFARNKEKHGVERANLYSARPGESEHQTGLVMDVTSPAVDNELVIAFEETDEGQWLQKHAQDFGFIIRYPKGKEDITGYQYEPWHLRYVGQEAAEAITSQNLTLEEYLLQK